MSEAYPTPPGTTVGAPVASGCTQLNGNHTGLAVTLPCTTGNILYAIVSSVDVNGNLIAILPSLVHPTTSDGTTFTAIASLPNAAQYTATCASTGNVVINVLISQSTLNIVLQVFEFLP
jgi:hypothetical protein